MPRNDEPSLIHNGTLCRASSLLFRIGDGVVRQGQGIFETIAVYRGKPFAMAAHYSRLCHGAEALELISPSLEDLNEQISRLLEANGLMKCEKVRLKITLAAGGVEPHQTQVTLTTQPASEAFPPAHIVTLPYSRNEKGALTGIKTVNYGENVSALRYAKGKGADEGLFSNTVDQLCEGIWCNVFIFLDGQWLTPPLTSGCLPGVTRQTLLDLADGSLPSICEQNTAMSDLDRIEAGFLTSSIREIQLIESLDGRPLRSGAFPEINAWHRAYRDCATK
ncbi:MAG: aminotransferase class IV [Verrucomicrobiota bacterium]